MSTNSLPMIRVPREPFWIPSEFPPLNSEFEIVTPDGFGPLPGSVMRPS